MFQPQVKLEFIRRYCSPADGWKVFVDIDPSEEGRTGGERITSEAKKRQRQMQADAKLVNKELINLTVSVGGKRAEWYDKENLPRVDGDRDIVAFHPKERRYLIAEVEGDSTGQPEQKVYKAIGQLVMAAGDSIESGWKRQLVLVVYGDKMSDCAGRAKALEKLEVSAITMSKTKEDDRWLFGGLTSF